MKVLNILYSAALAIKAVSSWVINKSFDEESIMKIENNLETIEINDNENFIYKIHCFKNNMKECNIIKNNLSNTLDILSNTLEFYQPIVFEAYIDDFTLYDMTGLGGGITFDINSIPLRLTNNTSSPPYVFPQALAKQLNLNKQPKFKKNDFILLISTRVCSSDLSRILLHEIFHGLGFQTQFSLIYENEESNNNLLIPVSLYNSNNDLKNKKSKEELDEAYENINISGFSPMTIFEKHIVDINTKKPIYENLTFLYKIFNQCLKDKVKLKDLDYDTYLKCYKTTMNHTLVNEVLNISKNYLLKSQSIGFLTNEDDTILLKTFDNSFDEGSSVCHTDTIKNYNDPEEVENNIGEENISKYFDENFIMYYKQFDDLPMETIIKSIINDENHNNVIGKGILDILKTLGWIEKGKERDVNNIYYLAEDIDLPEENEFEEYYMNVKVFNQIENNHDEEVSFYGLDDDDLDTNDDIDRYQCK
ncbi:hypothetical protein BCR32DRAFT_327831 [Anaeromyces robustus]|uniref:Uncharacterized protein n=1 Tax=Anaeromyces robustus TaxID=1754192 RepID=A0A1Y1X459_9FUNG|nr:hypothetical protein BCR32DRAFT_327831 [Anaeromyces robustus]|eukprot:ORX80104.1 hypothetical protein BCR32DRAFT_327831 [Anaeromyces robustus]